MNKGKEDSSTGLKRNLKTRHIQMIAFGGVIGTGLFQSIGSTIATAGPGGALLAYGLVGIMVFFIMSGLGEMALHMPITGSFETYAELYVDSSLSFGIGWIYWFSWAMTIGAEIVGCAIALANWFPTVPTVLWCAILLCLLVAINLMSANIYGETEFWLAGLKVITVILFIIFGGAMILGLFTGNFVGMSNFNSGGGAFSGGAFSIFQIFLLAGYAFQGEEMIGITAGESEDPAVAVKKSIGAIFFRVLIFYIGSIFVIGCLVPYSHLSLDISPFTMVFEQLGIPQASFIMNLVVLVAVFSCGNSGLYCSSRMLYTMAQEKKAPKWLGKVNTKGVPWQAVLFTGLVSALCLLSGVYAAGTIYLWLINASALCGFITWFFISFSHLRFRLGWIKQGYSKSQIAYQSPFFPVGHVITLVVCLLVMLGQGVALYNGAETDWIGIFTTYLSLPVFALMVLIHKKIKKTKIVKLAEIDYHMNGTVLAAEKISEDAVLQFTE